MVAGLAGGVEEREDAAVGIGEVAIFDEGGVAGGDEPRPGGGCLVGGAGEARGHAVEVQVGGDQEGRGGAAGALEGSVLDDQQVGAAVEEGVGAGEVAAGDGQQRGVGKICGGRFRLGVHVEGRLVGGTPVHEVGRHAAPFVHGLEVVGADILQCGVLEGTVLQAEHGHVVVVGEEVQLDAAADEAKVLDDDAEGVAAVEDIVFRRGDDGGAFLAAERHAAFWIDQRAGDAVGARGQEELAAAAVAAVAAPFGEPRVAGETEGLLGRALVEGGLEGGGVVRHAVAHGAEVADVHGFQRDGAANANGQAEREKCEVRFVHHGRSGVGGWGQHAVRRRARRQNDAGAETPFKTGS